MKDKIFVAEAMETEKGLFGLWTDKDHRDTPYVEYIRKKALLEWLDYLKGKVVGDEKRVLVLSIIDKINSL